MIDIQYSITIMGGVKYHIHTGFGFSPKARGFYVFVSVPQNFSIEPKFR